MEERITYEEYVRDMRSRAVRYWVYQGDTYCRGCVPWVDKSKFPMAWSDYFDSNQVPQPVWKWDWGMESAVCYVCEKELE